MTDKGIEDAVDPMLEERRDRWWPGLREHANGLMLRIDWLTDTECSAHPQRECGSRLLSGSGRPDWARMGSLRNDRRFYARKRLWWAMR